MFVVSLRCSNWYEGSDFLKAVALKNAALGDVTPCRMDESGQCFRRVQTAHYSETSVFSYQITAVISQKAVFLVLVV
jgi:hypothetical protein